MTPPPMIPRGRTAIRAWRFRSLPAAAVLPLLATVAEAEKPFAVLRVERDRVTAADLGRLFPAWRELPPETAIVYAPLPGLSREISRFELERLAVRHGLPDAGEGPEQVRIERRMRRLTALEAESSVAAALAERYRIAPEDVSVRVIGFPDPLVPAGDLRFRSTGVLPPPNQPATVSVSWVTPDRRSATLWLRAVVEVRGGYAIAARRLEARQKLQPGDVTFLNGPLPDPDRWRVNPSDVEGKMLSRSVAPGEKIARRWLVACPAVERGTRVMLELRRGAIQLRAPGQAEQPGFVGQRLVFRNLESGRRVTARLIDPGRAEVVP